MSVARSDQRSYRSPLPFDWRWNDFGFIGPEAVGFDGDPDDDFALRLRARSRQLLRVYGDAADVEGDNGVDVAMPANFPRLAGGLVLEDAEDGYATMAWPWTPPQMIGSDGFTVLVEFVEGGTIDRTSNTLGMVNFGKSGSRSTSLASFEIVKDTSGNDIYRAKLNLSGGLRQTSGSDYANNEINVDDEVVMLAGVERDAGDIRTFLDIWVDGVRLAGPFRSSYAARSVPAAWQDEIGAINARSNGTEVGTNTFRRIAWDRGVHTGPDGLEHFGVVL